jgi:branched-chain amino acid aminotransferase
MSAEFISINNQIISRETPLFTVGNRSFRYGDGFFESMRITGGEMPFIKNHFDRIKETAAVLEISLPKDFTIEKLQETVKLLSQKNNLKNEGKARINFFRNNGGLYAPEQNSSSILIDVIPIDAENGFESNNKGLKVDLYQKIKKPCNILSSIKSCNSLLYVLAGKYKTEHELDESVILNDKSNVCEFTSSNLFIVINGVLYTPSIAEGCIDGVMRKVILELASKARINVYETELKPNDLIRADEIFLTNAIQGVQWIGAYKTKRYFNKVSKILVDALNEHVAALKLQKES